MKKSAKISTRKAKVEADDVTETLKRRRVTFEINAGVGHTVSVAGSFNDWDPEAKVLVDKSGSGIYKGALLLAPGEYEYKFVVDDVWLLDENNPRFSSNDFGSLNSVVKVEC